MYDDPCVSDMKNVCLLAAPPVNAALCRRVDDERDWPGRCSLSTLTLPRRPAVVHMGVESGGMGGTPPPVEKSAGDVLQEMLIFRYFFLLLLNFTFPTFSKSSGRAPAGETELLVYVCTWVG